MVFSHNLDDGLAGLLDSQGERCLEAGVLVLEDDENLVWALPLAIFLRGKDNLEGIGTSESDLLRER
jgi:hypothetical protein